jgi:phosphoribosylaminoimidazolecarboxamide formyltransferase / IMP cyclohydrolase
VANPRVALLSTDDKTNVGRIGSLLVEAGYQLVSSGGTFRAISDWGVPATDIAEWTGFPPILNHRLVTYSAPVGAGLLADMDDPTHAADMAVHKFTPIDVVYFGLYNYERRLLEQGESWKTIIENMDVGGPAALCAAAKGARFVVTNPEEALSLAQLLAGGKTPNGRLLRVMQRNAVAAAVAHQSRVLAAMDGWLAKEGTFFAETP